jgi:hypothetical protein
MTSWCSACWKKVACLLVATLSAIGWSQVAAHCLELRTMLGLYKQRHGGFIRKVVEPSEVNWLKSPRVGEYRKLREKA